MSGKLTSLLRAMDPLRFIGRPNTMRFFGKTGITPKMITKLPKVSLLVVLALVSCAVYLYVRYAAAGAKEGSGAEVTQNAPKVDQNKVKQAAKWLSETIETLENYPSISANVRYRADLYGNQLGGTGEYREQRSGPIPKVLLKLEMPLADKMGALVEVCDGYSLWTYRRLIDDEKLTRINVRRVAQEMAEAGEYAPVEPMTGTIGMGGLAGLLRELRQNFQFELLGPSQFQSEPATQLRGRWRPNRLAALLPDQKDAILGGEQADLTKLTPHLPTEVLLTFGRDNRLPYRIEYRRSAATETEKDGGVTLEWFNLSVTDRMKPSDFEYYPGDVKWLDMTENLVKKIKARSKASKPKKK